MEINVEYTCKPNGQRELGLGKDYSLKCNQVVDIPWLKSATADVEKWLAGNLAVDLATHVRAAVGNVKSEKGEKIISPVSLAEWKNVVNSWNGRKIPFLNAIATPTGSSSYADMVKDAKELYTMTVGYGVPQETALRIVAEKYGIAADVLDLPTAEIVG